MKGVNELIADQGGSAGKLIQQGMSRRAVERLVRLSRNYEELARICMGLSLAPDDNYLMKSFDLKLVCLESIHEEYGADQENTAPGQVMTSGTAIK